MKLKGSAKKLTAKTAVLITCAAGALLLALHIFNCFAQIDPATGFFRNHTAATVPLFYILAFAVAAGAPLLSWLAPLSKAEYIACVKRPVHAVGCFAMAAGVVKSFADLFSAGERTRLVIATVVVGAVAAAALLVCGVAFLTGKELPKKARILYAFPALWGLCNAVSYFTIYGSYIKNSPLLLAIFADVFLMLFLFEYGRKVTGIAGDGNSPAYLGTALVCAVFQGCTAATGIVGIARGVEYLYVPFAFYRVCAVLFCLTAIAVFLKNNVPDYVPKPAQDAEIETHPLEEAAAENEPFEEEEEAAEEENGPSDNDEA